MPIVSKRPNSLRNNNLATSPLQEAGASPPHGRWSLQGGARGSWSGVLLVAIVALAASVSGFGNEFAQDDVPLVFEDERVHSLRNFSEIFTQPYWPEPFNRDLYRPFATLSFAVQWAAGGGSPVAFRMVSYLLYVLVSLSVLVLSGRLLPPKAALGVALLFAAHPVHVEAVALAVNQGEQWVGLISLFTVVRYLELRRSGWLSAKNWAGIGGLYLVACMFKEHAVIMPGLLLAAEITIVPSPAPRERVRRLLPGFTALAGVGGAFLATRSIVLGDFVGSFTAEALHGQGLSGRVLTMLQVVPEWGRLLVWPARLQGDYSPAVINQATQWGAPQTEGALLLTGVALALGLLWRRNPVASFGILWACVSLIPVSNIIVPTGITLAERTLYMPSIGFLLALGATVSGLSPLHRHRWAARFTAGAVVVLVALGVWRSSLRHPDWRNQVHYWARTVQDAPLSYRARHAFAQLLYANGHERAAVTEFNLAIALYPRAWWIRNELANRFRERGECYPALELYAESLRIEPDQPGARASRIACFLHLGHYEEAIAEAELAIEVGRAVEDFIEYRAVADSARRAGAPPNTVRLTVRDPEERW